MVRGGTPILEAGDRKLIFETGQPETDFAWSEVAVWLSEAACGVLSGESRTLPVRAVGWLLRLAETFDLRVSFSRGNEAGDPLWTVSGSIPLGSETMVLDTPVKSGDSVESSPRTAQIPHTGARPRGPT
jgi:hypothetical protein